MPDLARHRAYLEDAWRQAQAAPLSRRKVMLVAALIDAFVDHQFDADGAADDILEYRAARAASSPALALIMNLCSQRGVQLVLDTMQVPLGEYDRLGIEDFMVSLYNDHSVQRLRLALPDGGRLDMLETLKAAIAALQ
ncbi:hypothetical protein ACFSX5_14815 [Devosia albogilva]|uniref:Uncharacterized protein n=1 Tax=Devosia albogilva TaxID=429726 RepID=A0ABW5QN01_9HYPH